jgi:hypothetical protein
MIVDKTQHACSICPRMFLLSHRARASLSVPISIQDSQRIMHSSFLCILPIRISDGLIVRRMGECLGGDDATMELQELTMDNNHNFEGLACQVMAQAPHRKSGRASSTFYRRRLTASFSSTLAKGDGEQVRSCQHGFTSCLLQNGRGLLHQTRLHPEGTARRLQ